MYATVNNTEPPDGFHVPLVRMEPPEHLEARPVFPLHFEAPVGSEELAIGP